VDGAETKEDAERDPMIDDIMRGVGRTRDGHLMPDELAEAP
jgi:hypothetical protein